MLIAVFAAQVAFDHIVAIDRFANLQHLGVGQLRDAALGRNMHLLANLLGLLGADAVNILQRDDDALVGRNIDACDAGQALMLHFGRAAARG